MTTGGKTARRRDAWSVKLLAAGLLAVLPACRLAAQELPAIRTAVQLAAEEAVPRLRELVGKTNPKLAAFGTIRHDYATDIRQNCVHASDSPETAAREVGFFFKPSAFSRIRRGLKKIYRLPFVKR